MLENLKLNSFSEHLNTKFRFYVDAENSIEMELVEATDRGSNPKQQRFTILFRGPLDVALEQRIYKIEHDKIGSLDLFIVPVGTSETGREYEAIFNRLIR